MAKQVTPFIETFTCFHCGDSCSDRIDYDDHCFCCVGCKSVYQLLSQHNLCSYYDIEQTPGVSQRTPVSSGAFAYLDDERVAQQIIDYKDEHQAKVIFFIPTMHCSSC